jgi:lipopolysaccharide transport system permease protein
VQILPEAYAKWIWMNPVTPIVQALQAIFVQRAWPDWTSLLYPAVLAAVLGAVSAAVFRRQSPWIVDEL